MAVYAQIPEGCTFDDIVDTLAANGGTGMKSSDAASLFTTDAIKAVFAKFKPVRLASYFPDRTEPWYKGVDGLCGFSLSGAKANSFSELPSKYDGNMNGWVYLPPTGGPSSPYRIEDFEGYYPNAPAITNGFYVPEKISKTKTSADAQITLSLGNEYSLSWADFDTLKSYYFGVMLYNSDTNYIRVTAGTTLAEDGGTASFNPSTMPTGKYTAYPFICSAAHTQTDGAVSGEVIYALPLLKPIEVEVVSEDILVTFMPLFQYTNGASTTGNVDTISIKLTVINKTDSIMSFTDNYAVLKYKNGDESSITGNEKQMSLSDFTAAAGTSTIDLGSITSVNTEMRNNCYVLLSLNNAQYKVRREPAADINVGEQ